MRFLLIPLVNLLVLLRVLLGLPFRLLGARHRPAYIRFRLAGDPPYRERTRRPRLGLGGQGRPEPATVTSLERFREALEPGGVFAVMSYHSLEDRLVKNAFRDWSQACVCPPRVPQCTCRGVPLGETLTRKPVSASPEEIARNPRARSVRLRAWRRA